MDDPTVEPQVEDGEQVPERLELYSLERPLTPLERDSVHLAILQELRLARAVTEAQASHVIRLARAVDLLAIALSGKLRGPLGDGYVLESRDMAIVNNNVLRLYKNDLGRLVVLRLSVKQAGAGTGVLRRAVSGSALDIALDFSVLGDETAFLQVVPNGEVWVAPTAVLPAAVVHIEVNDPLGWISGVAIRPGG